MLRTSARKLTTSAVLAARAKPLAFPEQADQIKLRAPVVPTHKNFDVPETHPLWQFFPEGSKSETAFRDQATVQEIESRPWTMAELRRKSFVDLHHIWYEALKERNIVGREIRLAQSFDYDGMNKHMDIDADLALVQKRIKAVLLERQTAYERTQLLEGKQGQYLYEFRERYLRAAGAADTAAAIAMEEKFDRLKFALFGIRAEVHEIDAEHDVDVKFVQGVQYNADLKLSRYVEARGGLDAVDPVLAREPLVSVVEQLPFLLKETDEAVAEVLELRNAGVNTAIDKIDVIPFLKQAIGTHLQAAAAEADE